MRSIFLTVFSMVVLAALLNGCTGKQADQKHLSHEEADNIVSITGKLDKIEECFRMGGHPAQILRKDNILYIIPQQFVAQIKVIQTASDKIRIEHRARSRTIWGSPFGWDFVEALEGCSKAAD